ncbi:uncharacterized protein LOC133925556 [Phragmites australis]|uniref:uncharacterized protein LOC133925556 n=1 Tax=Phragmites australis TaxID=29695 RepID=UPI002D788EFA|nr:uncharacterized protein LOC133925556 [Phragmites australis]
MGTSTEMLDVIVNFKAEAKEFHGTTVTHSNLRCFLDTVTPIVKAHSMVPFLPLQNGYVEKIADGVKCFYLGELWNRFYEWSACGVGTSVRLPSGETIVQYFVPYLSAIQLYTNRADFFPSQRRFDEDNQHNVMDCLSKYGCETPLHKSKIGDERPISICKGELFFKYFELDSPYERMPFADKVYELCYKFPALASLSSVELSPSSWMSVFWYPISHTPAKNPKDLNTCFLTYHSLSTSKEYVALNDGHAFDHVALAPFGLVTLKLDEKVWASPDTSDQEHIASLFSSAQSWIKKHQIYHHDFNYFSCSNTFA